MSEHRWAATGAVDTGFQPPRRLWGCTCGNQEWGLDDAPAPCQWERIDAEREARRAKPSQPEPDHTRLEADLAALREAAQAVVDAIPVLVSPAQKDAFWASVAALRAVLASADSERITHGRHCTCSACAREDWTNPALAPCGMHGLFCPALYQPWGPAGSHRSADSESREETP
jgi:hypothetical protein